MTARLQTGPRSAARASDCALEEQHLLQRVRDGDEQAFATLLDRYHPSLVRLALVFVPNRPAAEGLVQDIWFEIARGVDPFDGRSSLKLWLARALMNRVRSTASYRDLAQRETDTSTEAVLSERFYPRDHPRWPGHWISEPASWSGLPADRLVAQETLARVRESINGLPRVQAQLITLRDVQAWTSEEVCMLLEISPENQRALLHRARSSVRQALESYLGGNGPSAVTLASESGET